MLATVRIVILSIVLSVASALLLPRAVLVGTGSELKEAQLEQLDYVLTSTISRPTSVVILADTDKLKSTRDLLLQGGEEASEASMERNHAALMRGRDHVLPPRDFPLFVPHIPVLLFSGTTREETMSTIRALRLMGGFPKCAFAVCVEPALDKSFETLLEEIQRDYIDERSK